MPGFAGLKDDHNHGLQGSTQSSSNQAMPGSNSQEGALANGSGFSPLLRAISSSDSKRLLDAISQGGAQLDQCIADLGKELGLDADKLEQITALSQTLCKSKRSVAEAKQSFSKIERSREQNKQRLAQLQKEKGIVSPENAKPNNDSFAIDYLAHRDGQGPEGGPNEGFNVPTPQQRAAQIASETRERALKAYELAKKEMQLKQAASAKSGYQGMPGQTGQQGMAEQAGQQGVYGQQGMPGYQGMQGQQGVYGQQGIAGQQGQMGMPSQGDYMSQPDSIDMLDMGNVLDNDFDDDDTFDGRKKIDHTSKLDYSNQQHDLEVIRKGGIAFKTKVLTPIADLYAEEHKKQYEKDRKLYITMHGIVKDYFYDLARAALNQGLCDRFKVEKGKRNYAVNVESDINQLTADIEIMLNNKKKGLPIATNTHKIALRTQGVHIAQKESIYSNYKDQDEIDLSDFHIPGLNTEPSKAHDKDSNGVSEQKKNFALNSQGEHGYDVNDLRHLGSQVASAISLSNNDQSVAPAGSFDLPSSFDKSSSSTEPASASQDQSCSEVHENSQAQASSESQERFQAQSDSQAYAQDSSTTTAEQSSAIKTDSQTLSYSQDVSDSQNQASSDSLPSSETQPSAVPSNSSELEASQSAVPSSSAEPEAGQSAGPSNSSELEASQSAVPSSSAEPEGVQGAKESVRVGTSSLADTNGHGDGAFSKQEITSTSLALSEQANRSLDSLVSNLADVEGYGDDISVDDILGSSFGDSLSLNPEIESQALKTTKVSDEKPKDKVSLEGLGAGTSPEPGSSSNKDQVPGGSTTTSKDAISEDLPPWSLGQEDKRSLIKPGANDVLPELDKLNASLPNKDGESSVGALHKSQDEALQTNNASTEFLASQDNSVQSANGSMVITQADLKGSSQSMSLNTPAQDGIITEPQSGIKRIDGSHDISAEEAKVQQASQSFSALNNSLKNAHSSEEKEAINKAKSSAALDFLDSLDGKFTKDIELIESKGPSPWSLMNQAQVINVEGHDIKLNFVKTTPLKKFSDNNFLASSDDNNKSTVDIFTVPLNCRYDGEVPTYKARNMLPHIDQMINEEQQKKALYEKELEQLELHKREMLSKGYVFHEESNALLRIRALNNSALNKELQERISKEGHTESNVYIFAPNAISAPQTNTPWSDVATIAPRLNLASPNTKANQAQASQAAAPATQAPQAAIPDAQVAQAQEAAKSVAVQQVQGHGVPSYGQGQPVQGQGMPNYGQSQPVQGHGVPSYGQSQQVQGQSVPARGQNGQSEQELWERPDYIADHDDLYNSPEAFSNSSMGGMPDFGDDSDEYSADIGAGYSGNFDLAAANALNEDVPMVQAEPIEGTDRVVSAPIVKLQALPGLRPMSDDDFYPDVLAKDEWLQTITKAFPNHGPEYSILTRTIRVIDANNADHWTIVVSRDDECDFFLPNIIKNLSEVAGTKLNIEVQKESYTPREAPCFKAYFAHQEAIAKARDHITKVHGFSILVKNLGLDLANVGVELYTKVQEHKAAHNPNLIEPLI